MVVSSYVAGFPVCDITGFNHVPGHYDQYTYQLSGATLETCMESCRANTTCQSVAYSQNFTQRLFYDQCVEKTQLWESDVSTFAHFDKPCDVCDKSRVGE
ncbi:hypothetical protein EJ08DRAFT_372476 [Tothia fuscella]|uniref:Apple domain-containing protein n=1 Tax=Tothia fuscella TaxID=1048955 RepID=A0A9P4NLE4_9PEZI|nr:hypothetical protein EJ08DRAFT_372476 [Tothia fuscella]